MYYNYPDEYGFPLLEESELNIFEIAYRSIYDDVEKTTKGYYAYLISLLIGGVPYNVYQEYGTGLSGALNLIHPRAKSTLKDTYTKMSYNINYLGFGSQPFMFPTANLIAKLFNAELIIERELNK